VAEMIAKNIKQLKDKMKNIPTILNWEGNPKDEWPKIHEARSQVRGCDEH